MVRVLKEFGEEISNHPSDVDAVHHCAVCVLAVLQSFRQDAAGRPNHPDRVPAKQGPLIVHQLSPESCVGSDKGSLIQNLLKSPPQAETLKPATQRPEPHQMKTTAEISSPGHQNQTGSQTGALQVTLLTSSGRP